MPRPKRTVDPHGQWPIVLNLSDYGFLATDALASIDSITPSDDDVEISNPGLNIEEMKVLFDVAGGTDGTTTTVEAIVLTELGRPIPVHVDIKWKEGASEEQE
jgi:hypothetical protein